MPNVGFVLLVIFSGYFGLIYKISVRHSRRRGLDSFWRQLHSLNGFSGGLVYLSRTVLLCCDDMVYIGHGSVA